LVARISDKLGLKLKEEEVNMNTNTRGYCFANTLNESYDLSQELLIKLK
jgi:hypothetical protein